MAMEAYTQTVPVGGHVVTINQVEDHGEAAHYALAIDDVLRGYIVRLPGAGRRWYLRSLPGDTAKDDLPGFWREDGQVNLFIRLAKNAVTHVREGRMPSEDELAAQRAAAHLALPDSARLISDVVAAWDRRPEDYKQASDIRTWLEDIMQPAVENARAAIAQTR